MANVEFGTGKTVIVITVVVGCFAVLWPRILYPMLTGTPHRQEEYDNLNGCCDVIFDTDINAIKIITEMCGTILSRQEDFNPKLSQSFHQEKLTKELINICRTEVLNICGIDIAEFLSKKEKIGHSYKQMLDEIRSFNISVCLRHHFGVSPGLLGAPRRMRTWGPSTSRHLRQERPLPFRGHIVHPALREKGRAIPHSHIVSRGESPDRDISGRPRSSSRPPMGGAGHVVAPKTGGTMSILMPMYTVGIVVFFLYTLMKIITKRSSQNEEMENFHSDPEFRRTVFSEDYSNGCAGRSGERPWPRGKQDTFIRRPDDSTRLGQKERDTIMSAITGLLAEVDQQLNREGDTQTQYSTELKDKKSLEEPNIEEIVVKKKKELELNEQVEIAKEEPILTKNEQTHAHSDLSGELKDDDTKPKVKVMGLELIAECEGGQKWSRPATPNLGVGGHSRPATPVTLPYTPEPQNIFLEGSLPQQSQLLVTDSKTQALTPAELDEPESPVILSSKMTLSLISLDATLPEENRQEEPVNQSQVEMKSENDNFGHPDSTLVDVDSDFIDETGQTDYDLSGVQEEGRLEPSDKQVNEITEDSSANYTTATSERAEAGLVPEMEDTTADMSNIEGLDLTEDQEDLQNEDIQLLLNGNLRESEDQVQSLNQDEEQNFN